MLRLRLPHNVSLVSVHGDFNLMSTVDVIDALERVRRQGAKVDEPEGARYVVISETALNQIIRELRGGAAERQDAECLGAQPVDTSR